MGDKESAKAYAAFLAYCDMGSGRSLRKMVEKYNKSTSYVRQLARWSIDHDWQRRVKEYDSEQAAERNEARRKRREEMEDRHARESQEEQEIARKLIKKDADKGHISLASVQLLKNSREDERKALGAEDSKGMALEVNANEDNLQVIVYYPQSKETEE